MSAPAITVTVEAKTERATLDAAKARGAAWFALPSQCVAASITSVEEMLHDGRDLGDDGGATLLAYRSRVEVQPAHRWSTPTYGPTKCLGCGLEDWERRR